MTTTTAGFLDREDVGQHITIHLPGKPRTGTLTGIHHSPDRAVRLELAGHHIIVHHSRKTTLGPA
ncbi:hypothetical protein [Brevibacterium otitidis]|uniref:DUF1918 domain-containing protein n=1 Tax=Brevibacterium otitidis TaxID=53364 RepID=A0ABV5X2H0_9MICO|nr:hypothetical protein GCM10023233_04760 [Brevibacterium otitidis]